MPAMWHGVALQKSYTATDHRKLFGYEMWQRAENKDLMAPTETTVRSVRKVLSDAFPCHSLTLLYLFLFLTLLLFKTHIVSGWQRSQNNPWNSALHVVFSGGPGIYSKTTDHNLIPWLNINSFLRTKKATGICYWAPHWVPLLLWEWAGLPRRRPGQHHARQSGWCSGPSAAPECALTGTESNSSGKAAPPVLTASHKSCSFARTNLESFLEGWSERSEGG